MKVEFCLMETGDVVFTKDSKEIENIINVITDKGCEIRIRISKSDIIHGYVNNVMYVVDAEENNESLRIYISNDFVTNEQREKISPEHIESVKIRNNHQ